MIVKSVGGQSHVIFLAENFRPFFSSRKIVKGLFLLEQSYMDIINGKIRV